MSSTDVSVVSRTILLFKQKIKIKIVSLRTRRSKKKTTGKDASPHMETVDILGPFNTTPVPAQSPSQANRKPALRVCETELLSAADFIEPTSAFEISDAIRSTLEKGLTPLFNAYQIAKLLPRSDIPRAVVIDVRKMRAVSVDPVTKTLTCSAGATVKDCDVAAAEHGLAVVAGTWSNLRMGGVALGGGYGWLGGQYGLVTDNLISATVVLADGRIVVASEDSEEHSDLFWGIRGSYTNLGICADFTFRCHEISHDVVFGSLVFPGLDMLDSILDAAIQIRTGKGDIRLIEDETWGERVDDGKTALSVRVEYDRPESGNFSAHILVLLFHNGPLQSAEDIFAPMLNISQSNASPSSSSSTLSPAYTGALTLMPYKEVNAQLDYTLDHTGDLTFVSTGFSVPVTYPSVNSTLSSLSSSLYKTLSSPSHAPNAKEYSVVLGIDFRHGRLACSPTNASKTVFAARFDGCMCYLRARWDGNNAIPEHESSNNGIRKFVKDVGKDMRSKVSVWKEDVGRNIGVSAYPGFCNQNDLEVKEMFGDVNYERLRALKEKYDRGNVFNGGFWKGTGGRGN